MYWNLQMAQAKIKIDHLLEIDPIGRNQEEFFKTFYTHSCHVLHGTAGSGKTFVAMYKALEEVLSAFKFKRVVILRSPVAARDIGALPGDVDEKSSVYQIPYEDMCHGLFNNREAYQRLKEQYKIEFAITSYLRGLTFDDSIIIVDEMQNMTYHEAYSVMTRVGENSKIIFCGDRKQSDIRDSGINKFIGVLKSMKETKCIEFTIEDIVRSKLVKSFIIAEEKYVNSN